MPERKIEVTEYRCNRCSYQWISRVVNEKHRRFVVGRYHSEWNNDFYSEYKPRSCPRCKSSLWDRRYITSEEKSLIAKLTGLSKYDYLKVYEKIGSGMFGDAVKELGYVCRNFLYAIQPTSEELRKAVYIDGKEDFELERELSDDGVRKKRQEIMLEILKSHGIIITEEDIEKDKQRQKDDWEKFSEDTDEARRIKYDMESKGLDPQKKEDREKYFETYTPKIQS